MGNAENALGLQIAAQSVRDIPKDKPLTERLDYAMRYVRAHRDEVFWMETSVDGDMMFRTSLAAVMLAGDEADRDLITRSMLPLRMLTAAMSGVPVDFGVLTMGDALEKLLPLMKLWMDSEKPLPPPEVVSDTTQPVETPPEG